ncbi:MAG: type IV pilin-like G/H family protein [Cyanobacteria bacterium P01_E01_bin.42]
MSKQKNSLRRNFRKLFGKVDEKIVNFLYLFYISLAVIYLPALAIVLPQIVSRVGVEERKAEAESIETLLKIASAQQAYFRRNKTFARQIDDLQFGLESETQNYSYRIMVFSKLTQTESTLVSEMEDLTAIATIAYPKRANLKIHFGVVQKITDSFTAELEVRSIICHPHATLSALKFKNDIVVDSPVFVASNPKNRVLSCPKNWLPAYNFGMNAVNLEIFGG